jgi:hypothetical protein
MVQEVLRRELEGQVRSKPELSAGEVVEVEDRGARSHSGRKPQVWKRGEARPCPSEALHSLLKLVCIFLKLSSYLLEPTY